MNTVGKVLLVAKGNLLGNLLNKVTAVLLFALPLAMTVVLGLVVSNVVRVPVGIVVEGDGPSSRDLVRSLEGDDTIELHRYGSRDALTRDVRRQLVSAGLVVPADYDRAVAHGAAVRLPFVVDESRPYPLASRTLIADEIGRHAGTLEAVGLTAEWAGSDVDSARQAVDHVPKPGAVTVDVRDVRGRQPSPLTGVQHAAPANLFMFMFVNALGFAGGMVVTRSLGCERRMLVSPTPPWVLLVGDFLGRFALALVQGCVIVAAGVALFGAHWGDPTAVAVLVGAYAAVSVAASELLGALATTREQTMAVAGPAGLTIGMLGGCVWPLAVVGPGMRHLAHLFPHAWAMDAAGRLSSGGAIGDIAGQVAVLVGYGLVVLALAHVAFRRRSRRAVPIGI